MKPINGFYIVDAHVAACQFSPSLPTANCSVCILFLHSSRIQIYLFFTNVVIKVHCFFFFFCLPFLDGHRSVRFQFRPFLCAYVKTRDTYTDNNSCTTDFHRAKISPFEKYASLPSYTRVQKFAFWCLKNESMAFWTGSFLLNSTFKGQSQEQMTAVGWIWWLHCRFPSPCPNVNWTSVTSKMFLPGAFVRIGCRVPDALYNLLSVVGTHSLSLSCRAFNDSQHVHVMQTSIRTRTSIRKPGSPGGGDVCETVRLVTPLHAPCFELYVRCCH